MAVTEGSPTKADAFQQFPLKRSEKFVGLKISAVQKRSDKSIRLKFVELKNIRKICRSTNFRKCGFFKKKNWNQNENN